MGPPGGQVQSYIRYGHGIDSVQEVLELATDLGFIDKAGAWFSCPFFQIEKDLAKKIKPDVDVDNDEAIIKAFKFQGQDKLYNFIKENPEIVKTLERLIKEALC